MPSLAEYNMPILTECWCDTAFFVLAVEQLCIHAFYNYTLWCVANDFSGFICYESYVMIQSELIDSVPLQCWNHRHEGFEEDRGSLALKKTQGVEFTWKILFLSSPLILLVIIWCKTVLCSKVILPEFLAKILILYFNVTFWMIGANDWFSFLVVFWNYVLAQCIVYNFILSSFPKDVDPSFKKKKT